MFKYSVIMPAYNAEKAINKSIESIIAQSYKNWELIIVNDGSTDGTLKLVETYVELDVRIKVITISNSGPGLARNTGIKAANGDYILFIDSDDYYDYNYLSNLEKVNQHEPKDIIFVDFINETSDGVEYGRSNIYSLNDSSKFEILCMQMTGRMPWGPVVKAIKREIIDGCIFSSFDVGEEAIFSFDVLSKSQSIGFVKKPLYHYVHNEEGQHKKGGLDPWGPVVDAMQKHLAELDMSKLYETNINSFALRALAINVYRISNSTHLIEAIKRINSSFVEYKKKYGLRRINIKTVSKSDLVIFLCLKLRLYFVLYFASKIRKK